MGKISNTKCEASLKSVPFPLLIIHIMFVANHHLLLMMSRSRKPKLELEMTVSYTACVTSGTKDVEKECLEVESFEFECLESHI